MVIAGARAYESPAFGQFCELFAIDVVAMVHFQAEESGVGQFHLGYSPYVLPSMYQGFKCVIVDRRLHDVEPLAHNFVLNFALDNRLRTEALD